MAITSMLFLFMFLPLSLLIYYIADDKAKDYMLLGISLLFYAIGSLQYFVIFLAAVCINVIVGRSIAGTDRILLRRILLAAGVFLNAGLLGYYKYTDFLLDTVNRLWNTSFELQHMLLPLGISFFTFKAISYLADIYRGQAVLDENPVHDMLYLSFFAQIQSGPITRYNEMNRKKDPDRKEGAGLFSDGVYRFLIGFNKKVLIANVISNISNEVFSQPFEKFSVSYAWLGAVCYSLQLFFDFSGYSDMAIGLSEMFGYNCMENFNYPYMTESVSKFWRRWHISLSQWFRDYVYIPLGGSRSPQKIRVYFNMFAVWVLTGIWHGAAWNFVIWGLGYFVMTGLERLTGYPEKLRNPVCKIIYRFLTLLFINFQWVLFRSESLHSGLIYIKKMLICQSNPLTDSRTLFLIKDYSLFLILAIVLCFPVVPWINRKLEGRKVLHTAYETVVGVLIVFAFIWAVSFVVSGQNNPFAYANF